MIDPEEIPLEDLEAAAEMFDALTSGSFYERNDAAMVEMFGHRMRYIGEEHNATHQ